MSKFPQYRRTVQLLIYSNTVSECLFSGGFTDKEVSLYAIVSFSHCNEGFAFVKVY